MNVLIPDQIITGYFIVLTPSHWLTITFRQIGYIIGSTIRSSRLGKHFDALRSTRGRNAWVESMLGLEYGLGQRVLEVRIDPA